MGDGIAQKKALPDQAVDVVLTPTPNTKFETHTSQLTITAGDPDYPENSAERIITLTQYPPPTRMKRVTSSSRTISHG